MTSGDRPSKTMCTHIGPHYTKFDLCTACCEVEIGRMMAALARYETHELRPCGCPNTLPTTCDCPCHKRAADETAAVRGPTDAEIDKFVDGLMGIFCVGDMIKTPHTLSSVMRETIRNWLKRTAEGKTDA